MFSCLKVAYILYTILELYRFTVAQNHFPNDHRNLKKEIVKNITPNKVDIIITLNTSDATKKCCGEYREEDFQNSMSNNLNQLNFLNPDKKCPGESHEGNSQNMLNNLNQLNLPSPNREYPGESREEYSQNMLNNLNQLNLPNSNREYPGESHEEYSQSNVLNNFNQLNLPNPNREYPGESREDCSQNNELNNLPLTNSFEETTTESFICTKEGTFPNANNCNDFFICHKKKGSDCELEQINLSCPKGMAFDQEINKCTSRAAKYCSSRDYEQY